MIPRRVRRGREVQCRDRPEGLEEEAVGQAI